MEPIHNETKVTLMQFEVLLLTTAAQGKLELFTECTLPHMQTSSPWC